MRYQWTPTGPGTTTTAFHLRVAEGMSFLMEILVLVSTFTSNTLLVPGTPWFLYQPARDVNRFVRSFCFLCVANEILTGNKTTIFVAIKV